MFVTIMYDLLNCAYVDGKVFVLGLLTLFDWKTKFKHPVNSKIIGKCFLLEAHVQAMMQCSPAMVEKKKKENEY